MAVRRGLFVQPTAGGVGTTPVDARIDLAGLLTPNGDLGVVPGVLSGLTVTGVASGWTYQVSAGHAVTTRGATDGAMLVSVDGNTNTPAPVLAGGGAGSTSAPVSGSRYEMIWILQRDLDAAETDNIAALGVTQGTASGSPTRPAVPTGALVIAEALIPTGAANTAAGTVTITSVAAKVGLRGGIVAVGSSTQRDLLNSFASATTPVYVDRLDTNTIERSVASGTWTYQAGAPATAPVTASYTGALWRVPTTQAGVPIVLEKRDKVITMRAGAFENALTSFGPIVATAQVAVGSLPAGYWPAAKVIVPAFVTNTNALTNTLGSLWFNTDGTIVFQTASGQTAPSAGQISVAVGSAVWVTP